MRACQRPYKLKRFKYNICNRADIVSKYHQIFYSNSRVINFIYSITCFELDNLKQFRLLHRKLKIDLLVQTRSFFFIDFSTSLVCFVPSINLYMLNVFVAQHISNFLYFQRTRGSHRLRPSSSYVKIDNASISMRLRIELHKEMSHRIVAQITLTTLSILHRNR